MFTGYLPPRYLMGEALHSNQLPLWNPYISFGLPFYGDMSSSYWSPLTWLIAATTGYNPYTLTIEVLLYLFASGAGMYYLSGYYSKNNYVRLVAAISYMCNGYIVGHLQHINWLSGAAFLPWCLWALEKLYSERNLKSLILSSLFFYLLIASSHPGITIGAAYLFAAYIISKLISSYRLSGKEGLLKTSKLYVLFGGFLLLVSTGLLIGFADIIPYFDRNEAVDLSLSLNQNTNTKSWISVFLPFATTKGDSFFQNDPAFRNIYIGTTLFLLFVISLFKVKSRPQLFFLLTGFFFLLLSTGNAIKLFAAKFFPLVGYVRVNAEFRIFALFCFIIVAIIFLNRFLTDRERYFKALRFSLIIVISITAALFLFGLINILTGNESVLQHIKTSGQKLTERDTIKQLLDRISLYDTLVVQGLIQIILLFLLLNAFHKNDLKKVFIITLIDIVLSTLLTLPTTGVGKLPVSTISSILKKSPTGIPTPTLQPVKENDTIPLSETKLIGDWSFYSKQPGSAHAALYPVKLINNYIYYKEAAKDSTVRITDMPFAYIANSIEEKKPKRTRSIAQQDIVSYKTGEIHFKIASDSSRFLVILQNLYPHWYYKTKGNILPVKQAGISFIAVPLEKGENDITLFFNPKNVKAGLFISAFTMLLFTALLLLPKFNRFTFKSLK